MRPSNHLITPSEALRRVFLPHLHTVPRTYATNSIPIPNRALNRPQCLSHPHPHPLPSPLLPQTPRNASTRGYAVQTPPYLQSSPKRTTRFGPKDTPSRHPRDEEIRTSKIYLIHSSSSRLPSDPQLLSTVLSSRTLDEKGRPTQYIQQVSPPSEDHPWPVCKMYEKKAAREAKEAKRKASKSNKMKVQAKQLEVNWTVSDNDLGHRMVALKRFLEKGWRVEVVFGSMRKSGWKERREASKEEAERVLEKIRKAVGEVEGAQEMPMQGMVGKEAILSFVGKAKK